MNLDTLNLKKEFKMLSVIDVSFNNLTSLLFLKKTPNVEHVFANSNKIRSFKHIAYPKNMQTLCLSNNNLTNFEGLQNIDVLQILSLKDNKINTIRGFKRFKKLINLDLSGNPIAKTDYFERLIASSLELNNYFILNGKRISSEIENKTKSGEDVINNKKLKFLMKMGYFPKNENSGEIDKFIEVLNQKATKDKVLKVLKIGHEGCFEEGKKITFSPFFINQKPNFLFKEIDNITNHTFRLTCRKKNIQIILEGIPIRMMTIHNTNSHELSLFIPAGEYKYKYVFDGIKDKKDRFAKVLKSEEKNENVFPNLTPEIVWYKDNNKGGWNIISDAKSLVYIPRKEDIGYCLKTEFLLKNNKNEIVVRAFSITKEIIEGFPECESIKIIGDQIEGCTLKGEAKYIGGKEGKSELFFYNTDDPETRFKDQYTLSIIDVGKEVVCEYTPVRYDGKRGKTVKIETGTIKVAQPKISELFFDGKFKVGEELSLKYDYFGGIEGESVIKWYRLNSKDDSLEEEKIVNIKKEYVLAEEDTGKILCANVIPISEEGLKGDVIKVFSEKIEP